MFVSNKFLSLCLIFKLMSIVIADNNMTVDDIEKRKSVREFFDSLVTGSSNQNSKSTQNSGNHMTNPGHRDMPIFMPFAVPMHSPQHQGPMSHPNYGYPSSMYGPPPPPPPPRHMSYAPMSAPNQHYGHMGPPNSGYAQMPPMNQNYGGMVGAPTQNYRGIAGAPTQNYGIVGPHNHYDYGQHSRPIAIAIPVPLHAIPLPYNPHNDEAHRAFSPQHNYLSNSDFGDGMSASTKYALFADPFDDSDEDLFDSNNRRFKVIPVEMNE